MTNMYHWESEKHMILTDDDVHSVNFNETAAAIVREHNAIVKKQGEEITALRAKCDRLAALVRAIDDRTHLMCCGDRDEYDAAQMRCLTTRAACHAAGDLKDGAT